MEGCPKDGGAGRCNFRPASSPIAIALAVPKDGNAAFLVFILGLPAETKRYPEDLDWAILEDTNS
jgi:hypothetical protein